MWVGGGREAALNSRVLPPAPSASSARTSSAWSARRPAAPPASSSAPPASAIARSASRTAARTAAGARAAALALHARCSRSWRWRRRRASLCACRASLSSRSTSRSSEVVRACSRVETAGVTVAGDHGSLGCCGDLRARCRSGDLLVLLRDVEEDERQDDHHARGGPQHVSVVFAGEEVGGPQPLQNIHVTTPGPKSHKTGFLFSRVPRRARSTRWRTRRLRSCRTGTGGCARAWSPGS